MIKGTRLIEGIDALAYRTMLNELTNICYDNKFQEVILPCIAEPNLWYERSSVEIENQMWSFKDKSNRDVCLIPEATAMIQKLYRDSWIMEKKKPFKIFYQTRCYRYERPQAGRYREFTQFGVEILGPNPDQYEDEAKTLLKKCLDNFYIKYDFNDEVVRGLSYYSRNGFEASCEKLGAQKQIAGGGTYAEGCGWAIGVDRALLAIK